MGVGTRKDGAKPSISTHIPGGVRVGVHSHHFLTSPILQKHVPVLETMEGLVPSLGGDRSFPKVRVLCSEKEPSGKIRFFPNQGLAACHSVLP